MEKLWCSNAGTDRFYGHHEERMAPEFARIRSSRSPWNVYGDRKRSSLTFTVIMEKSWRPTTGNNRFYGHHEELMASILAAGQ
ncbi:hypothetical protein HUG20_04605 [Salicibibacter cibi]|uniref:Uncharacterized protein n=1 Tax=Salicibibacter cibi TaxID=2743001 RepID=A0A7T6Z9A8_9BACI|nr:hypothetical protein [Salicibibacter cibi]QQK79239.1 hypothetical protein HUG20_04605 [Salicibibacter cibi]